MRVRHGWWLLPLLFAFICIACGDDDDNDDQTAADDDDTSGDDDDETADEPLAAAQALTDTWIASFPASIMGWSWDSGVLMLGIWELAELTGREAYFRYVMDWLDYHRQQGVTIAYNDHVPPARLALRCYEKYDQEYCARFVAQTRRYIYQEAGRLTDGALEHMGWQTPGQIWVDSLFMVTPFLVELGARDDNAGDYAEAVRQFELFAGHLQDPDDGLYRHRYDENDGSVTPAEADYWGRGNAWVIAASGTALRLLPAGLAGRDAILERLLIQAAAMAEVLNETNRWHTIMNRPETYLETSVGALYAYGVYQAASVEEVGDELLLAADRALRGALDQVLEDEAGNTLLLGTSYGTGPSTWEMYEEVLKGEQVNYGIGALLLAICAREELARETALPAARATDETYMAQPTDDDPIAWGYFYLARGNFYEADDSFSGVVDADSDQAPAQMGLMLIEAVRFGMDVLAIVDSYFVENPTLPELLSALLTAAGETGESLVWRATCLARGDDDFSRYLERFVLTEQGGSTAIGPVEVDMGEVYLLQAIGHLLLALDELAEIFGADRLAHLATVGDPAAIFLREADAGKLDPAALGESLDSLIAAIDSLLAAVAYIDAETDDQSDDLVPKNLIYLEGEFGVPGVMLPTPIDELLADLGIDPDELFNGDPMPQALVDFLLEIRGVLSLVRSLLP